MKLSKAQKEVIEKMRDGLHLFYTPHRDRYFFHGAQYSYWLRSDVVKELKKKRIISMGKYDYEMRLTKIGKTLNL